MRGTRIRNNGTLSAKFGAFGKFRFRTMRFASGGAFPQASQRWVKVDLDMKLPRIVKTLVALVTLALGANSALAQAEPFVGQLMMVPYNFAPVGWAMCEGQLLSISQNTALFALIGTQYGGDGISNFALPDFRGRFPLGTGNSEHPFNGQMGGAESYTLTVAQLPAHSHPLMAASAEATLSSPAGAVLASKARVPLYAAATDGTMMSAGAIGSTGGSQPYPVMPPYTTVTFCIALNGVFPSRG
jgi:microcystin-dependent protein